MVLSTLDSRFDRVTLTYLICYLRKSIASRLWIVALISMAVMFSSHSKVHLGLRVAYSFGTFLCGHKIVLK